MNVVGTREKVFRGSRERGEKSYSRPRVNAPQFRSGFTCTRGGGVPPGFGSLKTGPKFFFPGEEFKKGKSGFGGEEVFEGSMTPW